MTLHRRQYLCLPDIKTDAGCRQRVTFLWFAFMRVDQPLRVAFPAC